MTNSIGSIPHFRGGGGTGYTASITEITLRKDQEPLVTYTVGEDNLSITASDIAIFEDGAYSSTGTYVWTIKATGYEDNVITVEVTS